MSTTEKPLVNRVAKSPLITLNLENYYPTQAIQELDLKQFLFKELILKEKDFREAVAEFNWSAYEGHVICIICSADAIIPVWAYMLVASEAEGHARDVFWGSEQEYIRYYYRTFIDAFDVSPYEDKMIVIKGCSGKPVPASAYLDLTRKLRPIVKSVMYGEPCSTVPIYKKKK